MSPPRASRRLAAASRRRATIGRRWRAKGCAAPERHAAGAGNNRTAAGGVRAGSGGTGRPPASLSPTQPNPAQPAPRPRSRPAAPAPPWRTRKVGLTAQAPRRGLLREARGTSPPPPPPPLHTRNGRRSEGSEDGARRPPPNPVARRFPSPPGRAGEACGPTCRGGGDAARGGGGILPGSRSLPPPFSPFDGARRREFVFSEQRPVGWCRWGGPQKCRVSSSSPPPREGCRQLPAYCRQRDVTGHTAMFRGCPPKGLAALVWFL